MLGEHDTATELSGIAVEIIQLTAEMDRGAIEADEFESRIVALTGQAQTAFGELAAIDRAGFGQVTSALDGFISRLGDAVTRARELRASLPGNDGTGGTTPQVYGEVGARGDPRQFGNYRERSDLAPSESPRPQRPGVDSLPALAPLAPLSGGGGGGGGASTAGGGGGGAPKLSDYAKNLADTRDEIAKMEAEAIELAAVAASGREYGDALEYARKRAELLHDAQTSGREITPELKAKIDNLALSYTEAGLRAEDAAERLRLIVANAERGADRLSSMFMGILDGSASAKDALKGLLAEIAKVQLQKAIAGIGAGFSGGLLSGGRATGGPVRRGGAYMVNEGTARSEVFVPSQSGAVLNVPQAQAALRDTVGSGTAGTRHDTNVTVNASPLLVATIDNRASTKVRDGLSACDGEAARRQRDVAANPRRIER